MLAVVAQLVEGFSLDTFALPQVWLANGIISIAFVHLLAGAGSQNKPQASAHEGPAMLESDTA